MLQMIWVKTKTYIQTNKNVILPFFFFFLFSWSDVLVLQEQPGNQPARGVCYLGHMGSVSYQNSIILIKISDFFPSFTKWSGVVLVLSLAPLLSKTISAHQNMYWGKKYNSLCHSIQWDLSQAKHHWKWVYTFSDHSCNRLVKQNNQCFHRNEWL